MLLPSRLPDCLPSPSNIKDDAVKKRGGRDVQPDLIQEVSGDVKALVSSLMFIHPLTCFIRLSRMPLYMYKKELRSFFKS